MTALRRLLHRVGFHWWGKWRSNYEIQGGPNASIRVTFQRRHCRVPGCEAEERREREA